MYLGANIGKYRFDGDTTDYWYMSSDHYVKESIRNVENYLEKQNRQLKSKAPSVLPTGYVPELDVTQELEDEHVSTYQEFVGVLRWAVELGRVDIATEVSIMAGFSAAPRLGHLKHCCTFSPT